MYVSDYVVIDSSIQIRDIWTAADAQNEWLSVKTSRFC